MAIASRMAPAPAVETPSGGHRPVWPKLLAVAVVAQPLLVAVNATFHPEVELNGPGLLHGASESSSTWFAVHMVAAVGGLLAAPAALGLRRLVAGRGRRLADAATAAAFIAATILPITFAAEASVMRLLADTGIDRDSAVVLADAFTETPEFYAVIVGAGAAAAAGILFAIALLRAGEVPRWMPGLLLVGSAATLAAAPGTVVGPIAFALVTVAAAGLAPRVARAGTGPSSP